MQSRLCMASIGNKWRVKKDEVSNGCCGRRFLSRNSSTPVTRCLLQAAVSRRSVYGRLVLFARHSGQTSLVPDQWVRPNMLQRASSSAFTIMRTNFQGGPLPPIPSRASISRSRNRTSQILRSSLFFLIFDAQRKWVNLSVPALSNEEKLMQSAESFLEQGPASSCMAKGIVWSNSSTDLPRKQVC